MIERKFTGQKPGIRLPKGTVDTQTHLFLPGYPAVDPGPEPLDSLNTGDGDSASVEPPMEHR